MERGQDTLRHVVIYPGEHGSWVAECLSLPGCFSQGETKAAALANIRDANRVSVAARKEDRLPGLEEQSIAASPRAQVVATASTSRNDRTCETPSSPMLTP